MSVEYNGTNYRVEESLALPNPGNEIGTYDLLTTDDYYGLLADGEELSVFRMSNKSIIYSTAFPFRSLSHAGSVEINGYFGALYSDTSRAGDQVIFVHASKDDFFVTYYQGLSSGKAVAGSFTGLGLVQVAFANGLVFELHNNTFVVTNFLGITEEQGPMAAMDLDGDGLDEIVMHWQDSVACFSGPHLKLIWATDVAIGMVILY